MSDSDTNSTAPQEVIEETSDNSASLEKGEAVEKKVPETDNHDGDVRDDHHGKEEEGVVRDIIMWRRRKVSAVLVVAATVLWMTLEIYRFNFLPLASYTAMGFTTLLFLYGCVLALLRKEVGDMKGWEISEERAKEMAVSAKRLMEKGIRSIFHISCEREWYTFVGVISALLLLGYLGRLFNLHTLLYAGTMVGMTVPVIYVKKEEQIKAYGERVRQQAARLRTKFDDKVFSKFKSKEEMKQKKVE